MNQNSHTEASDSCPIEETETNAQNTEQSTTLTAEEAFLASMLAGRDVSDLSDPVHEQNVYDAAYALLTEEQQQHVIENKALDTVFYDIRERSHSGELTTCDYWSAVDLVPSHMTPEAFTALVMQTIENAQYINVAADSGSAGKGTAGLEPTHDINPRVPGHTTPHHTSSYSTTVVKTAKDFMEEARRAAQSEAQVHKAAEVSATQAEAPKKTPSEPVDEAAKGTAVTPAIAAKGAAVTPAIPDEPKEPSSEALRPQQGEDANAPKCDSDSLESDDMQTVNPEIQAKLDELLAEPTWDVTDIQIITGSEPYIYSRRGMTDSYAHWAFLAAEDNDITTFVDTVRTESQLYPRPMILDSLYNKPFYMDDERIWAAFNAIQELDQYNDILKCSASNGDIYFYSTLYLSSAQAQALAEWFSVERKANM